MLTSAHLQTICNRSRGIGALHATTVDGQGDDRRDSTWHSMANLNRLPCPPYFVTPQTNVQECSPLSVEHSGIHESTGEVNVYCATVPEAGPLTIKREGSPIELPVKDARQGTSVIGDGCNLADHILIAQDANHRSALANPSLVGFIAFCDLEGKSSLTSYRRRRRWRRRRLCGCG